MKNAKRDAGRERLWRALLKRQAVSGLSVRAFCRREKVAESNFYAWRREIGLRDREATGRDGKIKQAKASPAFLPVTGHCVAANGHREREAGIVLERDGGLRLRLPESIAVERLAAIVRALEREVAS